MKKKKHAPVLVIYDFTIHCSVSIWLMAMTTTELDVTEVVEEKPFTSCQNQKNILV